MSLSGTKYPASIDRVDQLPDSPRERKLLVELQQRVGTVDGNGDEDNHEKRLSTVEDELDAITSAVEIGPNDVSIPAHTLSVRRSVNAQEGHGQLIHAPSITAGYPKERNGIVRFYCLDTDGYIDVEAPDSIMQNRKVYLQDRPGRLSVEDTSGWIEAGTGFMVNGVPVVQSRQSSISIPDVPGFSGPESPGYGWKSDTELSDFFNFVKDLHGTVTALRDALIAHGLIES